MKFKEPENRNQFFSLHPKLCVILCDMDLYCLTKYQTEIIVTELIRVALHQDDIHAARRGADVRSWTFTPNQVNDIVAYLNAQFPYGDDVHPTCLYHKTASGNYHFCKVLFNPAFKLVNADDECASKFLFPINEMLKLTSKKIKQNMQRISRQGELERQQPMHWQMP